MITDDEAKQFLDTLKKICKAEPNKQLQQVNLNLGKNSEYGIEEIYLYNETKKERYTSRHIVCHDQLGVHVMALLFLCRKNELLHPAVRFPWNNHCSAHLAVSCQPHSTSWRTNQFLSIFKVKRKTA